MWCVSLQVTVGCICFLKLPKVMGGVRERAAALRGTLGIGTSGTSGTALRAADLRCSLFVAALLTYRRPTCLKPFPPFHVCNGIKQFEKLVYTLCFFGHKYIDVR